VLRWVFICDGCGLEAPGVPVMGRMPARWMCRTTIDRVEIDAESGGSQLQRESHYCPLCKVKAVAA
jgi:hypothetical protein